MRVTSRNATLRCHPSWRRLLEPDIPSCAGRYRCEDSLLWLQNAHASQCTFPVTAKRKLCHHTETPTRSCVARAHCLKPSDWKPGPLAASLVPTCSLTGSPAAAEATIRLVLCACVCVCACMCACARVCVHVCVCACACIMCPSVSLCVRPARLLGGEDQPVHRQGLQGEGTNLRRLKCMVKTNSYTGKAYKVRERT